MKGDIDPERNRPNKGLWKARSDGGLSYRCWDGEYVVFNPASGNTHLLDIASGEVLMVLLSEPAGNDRIAERLADFLEVGNDESLKTAVREILDELEELGLIEFTAKC
ncbi:MAG: HPr-rel-A system PqqD family peptide chaperone [Kiloniellaceae bacterium]